VGGRPGTLEGVALSSTLVTGAHGLFGLWLVRALLERGDRVVIMERAGAPASPLALEGLLGSVTTARGDVRDAAALEEVVRAHRPDAVFHLAAQTIVGAAQDAPGQTFEVNVRGTWLLLEACLRHGVGRVVVAGSAKVYGPREYQPATEDQPLAPLYPYDVSKACADLVARCFWHAYGLPVAVTRFANVYGGGDLNASRLIPASVAAALAGRAPVVRSDGSPRRHFVYVEDAVAAQLLIDQALGDPGGGARGEAFNGGADHPHAVGEVAELVCRLAGLGASPDVRGTAPPAGELDSEQVDSSKLHRLTGWRPRVDLEEGLRRTLDWYRAHPGALSPA